MLLGIHPLLNGVILHRLDALGHSDAVVIADANFPAHRLDANAIDLPGTSAPDLVAAIRTVLPLDDAPAAFLMESPEGELPIHRELMTAVGDETRYMERHAFYEAAAEACLVIRTGETRPYGNVLLLKGVVK